MTSSRKQKLEAMLADDPSDRMLRYMLALELEKEGQHDESLAQLQSLMQEDPPHVPAFLMAGQQLARLGKSEQARETYRQGIAAADAQGDDHASGEMAQFLAELPPE